MGFGPCLAHPLETFLRIQVVSHKLGYNHPLGGSSKYLHGLGCLSAPFGAEKGSLDTQSVLYTSMYAHKKKPIYIVLLLWKRRPFVET